MPSPPRKPFCGNEDHGPRTAVVSLTWPDGRYLPATACRTCLRWSIANAISEGYPITITPIKREAA